MISELYAVGTGILIMIIVVAIMLKKEYSYGRILSAAIFVLYLTSVISLTFFPIRFSKTIDPDFNIFKYNLKLIPFENIILFIKRGHLGYFLVQIGGNFLMTIPFGALLPIVYKAKKQIYYPIIFFCFTFCIEVTQLLIGAILNTYYRTADVDDIILNFTGAMLGYLIFRIIQRISPKKSNRPITPRHIAKKKRSETDLSNSNKFSIWQHRNIRTK